MAKTKPKELSVSCETLTITLSEKEGAKLTVENIQATGEEKLVHKLLEKLSLGVELINAITQKAKYEAP